MSEEGARYITASKIEPYTREKAVKIAESIQRAQDMPPARTMEEHLNNEPKPDFKASEDMHEFERIGRELGALTDKKNQAYGDSFLRMGAIMVYIYPEGVRPEQYQDFIAIARLMDKFSRIAADKGAFGENPWADVCGYSILMSSERGNK